MLAWVVDMASSVVTPSATRAGTALWSSQKESQDTDTVMEQGMYTCTLGTPSVGELKKLFTLGNCYYDCPQVVSTGSSLYSFAGWP